MNEGMYNLLLVVGFATIVAASTYVILTMMNVKTACPPYINVKYQDEKDIIGECKFTRTEFSDKEIICTNTGMTNTNGNLLITNSNFSNSTIKGYVYIGD